MVTTEFLHDTQHHNQSSRKTNAWKRISQLEGSRFLGVWTLELIHDISSLDVGDIEGHKSLRVNRVKLTIGDQFKFSYLPFASKESFLH